jgi:hypothetical protein
MYGKVLIDEEYRTETGSLEPQEQEQEEMGRFFSSQTE